ncbi:hypothetical protein FSP39_007592 [Pinctada imbricata]|uniref:PLA2c domain-containing protein n=1 Tax=Pinctada imbricata TaxID=66713 RepID=A0AA89C0S8_PINIB|nr:hypothetical protein FSP39_007592 [Pinctada imbricata]
MPWRTVSAEKQKRHKQEKTELLLMKGKLVIWKLKSSRLSYNDVFKWPFASKDRSIPSPLRLGEDLCDGEVLATRQRKIHMARTFGNYLGNNEQISVDKIPNIAVIGSGGGVRAMTAMSSVFCTLHDEELLQYIMYVAGLSGSSWYLTTLYSHKDWPKIHPKIVHEEIKERVLNDLFNKLNEILKVPGTWLSNLILEHKPYNLTQLFGLFLGSNLIPDRYTTSWSNQRDKVKDGRVPFPLLACIHAKSDTPAKDYHEWVEISPFEVGIPKYGIGVDASLFGSEFDRGQLVERMQELPLYYINGICGSAFTILNDEMEPLDKVEENPKEEHEYDVVDGKCISQREHEKSDLEAENTNNPVIVPDIVLCEREISEENVKEGDKDEAEVLNVVQSEEDPVFDDRLQRIQHDLKRAFLNTRDLRAAWLNSPLRNLSFDERSPSLKDRLGRFFSRVFEKAERDPQLCFVDAGFAFNSPYPLVLRAPRSVDLILSFDFTDRNGVNGDPFKNGQDLHKVKFPPVPEFDPHTDVVRELYILEDEHDPLCPVIMHFVLVNRDFKQFRSPGIKRQTSEEAAFANFDLFKDKSCIYNSQNFQYTNEQFERLSELVRFNIQNNRERIKEQIQKVTERRAANKT